MHFFFINNDTTVSMCTHKHTYAHLQLLIHVACRAWNSSCTFFSLWHTCTHIHLYTIHLLESFQQFISLLQLAKKKLQRPRHHGWRIMCTRRKMHKHFDKGPALKVVKVEDLCVKRPTRKQTPIQEKLNAKNYRNSKQTRIVHEDVWVIGHCWERKSTVEHKSSNPCMLRTKPICTWQSIFSHSSSCTISFSFQKLVSNNLIPCLQSSAHQGKVIIVKAATRFHCVTKRVTLGP